MNSDDHSRALRLFGCAVDNVALQDTVATVYAWAKGSHSVCRYIVTPNVKHFVLLQENAELRQAYENADLVVVDSRPIAFLCWLVGIPLRGVVPGSDLVPELFASAEEHGGLRVFLLGAAPGVAERAASSIQARWPWVRVVGAYSPRFGFEHDAREQLAMLAAVRSAEPEFLLIGLGAPKQERWISDNRHSVAAKVALCAGAAIDFLAGEKTRAPLWMRTIGLEWAYRSVTEPRRIGLPTLRNGMIISGLVFRRACFRSPVIEKTAGNDPVSRIHPPTDTPL